MRTFGVGHDHGNSRTTVITYVNGGECLRTFPSASANGSLKHLAKIRRAEGRDNIIVDYQALEKDEYVLSLDGVEHFIGNLALTQGEQASTGRNDAHRYWSRRSLEALLVAASDVIPDQTFELLVVTGLPVATFNEETRKRVKTALGGMHHFTFKGYERTAYVKVGKVLMEGAGASLLHDIDANDDIYGFIDIGGRTTDLYVRQGLQAIAKLCAGRGDIGVESAADTISQWFEEKYGFALPLLDRTRILQSYVTHSPYPTIKADGLLVPEKELAQWTKNAFSETGKRIAEFVSQTWHTGDTGKVAANFTQVDVVGGGAYYFLDALRTIIPRVTVPSQPEHANARGYGWFANELVKQRAQVAS